MHAAQSSGACVRGGFQMRSFAPRARNPALFAKGVYSYGTRPEQKGPGDAAIWTKELFGNCPYTGSW